MLLLALYDEGNPLESILTLNARRVLLVLALYDEEIELGIYTKRLSS